MPVTPPTGSCQPWVSAADLARCRTVESCAGCDPSVVPSSPTQTWTDAELAAAATELLYEASGRRFPGTCTCTIWPAEERCGHLTRWCGCQTLPVVELDSQWPVLGIVQVKIDGAVVDANTYRVDDWSRLVRVADPTTGINPGWPIVRYPDRDHPTEPTPGAGTFSVQFEYGRAIPQLGKIAALALACHLRSWTEPVANLVGDNVTSLSYAGMSMARESTTEAIAAGRTGIIEVDRFLETVNGTEPPKRRSDSMVGIWTPGLDLAAPTRRTWP